MAQGISKGVGKGQPNLKADVQLVQSLLNLDPDVTGQVLQDDGLFGGQTLAAIVAYQAVVLEMPVPDGVISVGGPTITSLLAQTVQVIAAAVPDLLLPQSPAPAGTLLKADYAAAADQLRCEVAAIQAVGGVETGPQGAFDTQGRPTILFERHLFHARTGGRFDASDPDISNPVRGGYGTFAVQYPKITRAAALDFDAALQSASWGTFQILGLNSSPAGFDTAEDFVTAMRTGASAHLTAFCSFIAANPGLLKAIRAKDWTTFARGYNGPGFAQQKYDVKLAQAYAKFSA